MRRSLNRPCAGPSPPPTPDAPSRCGEPTAAAPRSGGDGPGENYASSELRTDVPRPNARPQKRDAASSLPRPETRGLTLSARASGPLLAATGIVGPLEARRTWGRGVVGSWGRAGGRRIASGFFVVLQGMMSLLGRSKVRGTTPRFPVRSLLCPTAQASFGCRALGRPGARRDPKRVVLPVSPAGAPSTLGNREQLREGRARRVDRAAGRTGKSRGSRGRGWSPMRTYRAVAVDGSSTRRPRGRGRGSRRVARVGLRAAGEASRGAVCLPRGAGAGGGQSVTAIASRPAPRPHGPLSLSSAPPPPKPSRPPRCAGEPSPEPLRTLLDWGEQLCLSRRRGPRLWTGPALRGWDARRACGCVGVRAGLVWGGSSAGRLPAILWGRLRTRFEVPVCGEAEGGSGWATCPEPHGQGPGERTLRSRFPITAAAQTEEERESGTACWPDRRRDLAGTALWPGVCPRRKLLPAARSPWRGASAVPCQPGGGEGVTSSSPDGSLSGEGFSCSADRCPWQVRRGRGAFPWRNVSVRSPAPGMLDPRGRCR